MHLLHRRLGPTLAKSSARALADAFHDGTEPPLPFVESSADEGTRVFESDAMIDQWEAISLHVWPMPLIGETHFDPTALQTLGVQISELQEALSIPVPEAVGLFRGELIPSTEQVELLSQRLGAQADQLLLSSVDDLSLLMFEPEFKDDLLRIAETYNTDETKARSMVRSEFALAARSDGNPRTRLRAAIHRLSNSAQES